VEDEDDDEELLEVDDEEEAVEVVLEDVVEEVDEELVEVVEELDEVVEGVEDAVWLVDTVCDWVAVVFEDDELRTRYPPTATTRTTTTIAPKIAVLSALRRPRANFGVRPDVRLLRLNII
jgi:hypothetical protein